MTEAMSRREIEDVLSSIRRIVSHDVHPNQTPAPQEDLREKLILTSALRVDAGASDIPSDTTLSEGVPVPEDGASMQADASSEIPSADPDTTSLLGRISTASKVSAPVLDVDLQPDPQADVSQLTIHSEDADLSASLEDSALEATLARLEAMLANPVQPGHVGTVPETTSSMGDEVIDEGVLYQLVAHIVRQELQGELGEKITRNIRKLVRAEVARELQLRNF